jgi:hypothetical protein
MTGQMALRHAGLGDRPSRAIESGENEPASARPVYEAIREP